MDTVALDDGAFHAPGTGAHRAHARVHVHPDLPALAVRVAKASPAADVVVFDHDVVRAGQQANRILLRALELEAAHNHIRRSDRDVVRLAVRAIDGCVSGVKHITGRAAAFGNGERLSTLHTYGARDGELVAPCVRREAIAAELDFILGARLELHQAAAAFAVARIEPERQPVTPCGV